MYRTICDAIILYAGTEDFKAEIGHGLTASTGQAMLRKS
jgi:hypothetical protein